MEEIDFKGIFNMFWSKKVQVFIFVLIFVILGCIYTIKFTTPIYSASITIILVSSNNENGENSTITTSDLTVNSKLISTYSVLINSKNVLKEVADNLNIDMDEETLKNHITVASIQNSELIKITVKNENPTYSAQIANEIARVFSEKVKELYNINNVQIMGEAEVPQTPSNINHKKDVALFAIGGFLVASIYVFLSSLLDNTIKDAQSVESEFNLPVLASIPNYEKGGK